MAFKRCCLLIAVTIFFIVFTKGQTTVWYPAGASQLLKSTAEDVASLLQQSGNASVQAQPYTSVPGSGFIFCYTNTITDNQACHVSATSTKVMFIAAEDNGLVFGAYQYLRQLGFRFYQPGSIWEIIPSLSSAYTNMDTVFTSSFKYKSWFISGGHNRWAMDNNSNYGWDTYFGENGHNWALYQRRNGMLGAYRFSGHRGDIMTGSYLQTIQQNPCYVACYNNSRAATTQSVPDINNTAAKNLWANAIEQKFTQFKNTIYNNTGLYANYYRNFGYNYGNIGIEVPDGARWGNSNDNTCDAVEYASPGNQHFALANATAEKINAVYPAKKMQVYAYSTHAGTPDAVINNNIDVMVIPTAFQNESSAKGLMNKWYSKHPNVSEYHYMNITQWGGESPMFYSNELKTTLARLSEKASQGIVWEASPAKFASLPFLLAANNDLLKNQHFDASLHEFCNNLFGNASTTIYTLLKAWSSDEVVTTGNFIQDNKYKLPYYIELVKKASDETVTSPAVVKQRVLELKAYLHYLVLNFNWYYDARTADAKQDKAAALCLYVAKANKLQVVNSYFVIQDVVSKFAPGSSFYSQYNVTNGTAYVNGSLPLLTDAEIEANFTNDAASSKISGYTFETAGDIQKKLHQGGLSPLKKIHVRIGYTNGMDYNNRTDYCIYAPAAGSFTIAYKPSFNDDKKGYIHFVVEDINKPLGIIKEFTLTKNSNNGTETVQIPGSGTYRLTIVSRYQSSVELDIETSRNYFYKASAFIGNKTESYRNNPVSLPGFFYVPAGVSKVYFSVNNSLSNGKYAGEAEVNKSYSIRDNNNNIITARIAASSDSTLFYFDVPLENAGTFWQVFKMEQYNLCFANISNVLWYAQRKPCANSDFVIDFVKKNGSCITRLQSKTAGSLSWEIYDLGRWINVGNQTTAELPENISPYAVITLRQGNNCSVTKVLGEDENYIKYKPACASAAAVGLTEEKPALFPSPTTGTVNCSLKGVSVIADEVRVFNNDGVLVASFKNTRQFNIANLPAGTYNYQVTVSQQHTKGLLIKL